MRWLFLHMNIHPNTYYNYLKKTKTNYHRQKKAILNAIRDIYHECSGSIGHRFMKVFLGRRDIYLSKTTVHKYMNKEMKLKGICRRKKPNYKKATPTDSFPIFSSKTLSLLSQIVYGVRTLLIYI